MSAAAPFPLAAVALLATCATTAAHFPPLPTGSCDPAQTYHDYLPVAVGGQVAIGSLGVQTAFVLDGAAGSVCGSGLGDGDSEFGFGGAFLPATHHAPATTGFTVAPATTDGPFVLGSDGDPDGIVDQANPLDCYEAYAASGAYVSACAAGADGGWWFFAACSGTTCLGLGHVS